MDWIKCEVELPKERALVVICDDENSLEIAWRDKDGWWWSENGYAEFSQNVLYWYPLPELPQI